MKQLFVVLLLSSVAFVFGTQAVAKDKPAKTWSGFLCDKMCAKRMAADSAKCANHAKACMTDEMCSKSGYGLVVDGKFYKFDKKGDELAAAWLATTTKTKDMQVTVTGIMDGTTIKVTDVKEGM